jgi:HEPN domain-containing protein
VSREALGPAALIAHAHELLALAESHGADQAGAGGLAYQAADLSIKALLVAVDGADMWAHEARRARVEALVGVAADDQAFLHRVRQLDFYGDASFGGPLELPSAEERVRALAIARRIVDAIDENRASVSS